MCDVSHLIEYADFINVFYLQQNTNFPVSVLRFINKLYTNNHLRQWLVTPEMWKCKITNIQ